MTQDAKEAQLKEHFGQFGVIETVTLKTDMATGQSRGFCFIVYKSVNSLEEVVAAEHTFSNKKVAVKKAQAKGTIYLYFILTSLLRSNFQRCKKKLLKYVVRYFFIF